MAYTILYVTIYHCHVMPVVLGSRRKAADPPLRNVRNVFALFQTIADQDSTFAVATDFEANLAKALVATVERTSNVPSKTQQAT